MLVIKKEIQTTHGLFKIGSSGSDFMLNFVSNSRGVHQCKHKFKSVKEAEMYVSLLNINGFKLSDL